MAVAVARVVSVADRVAVVADEGDLLRRRRRVGWRRGRRRRRVGWRRRVGRRRRVGWRRGVRRLLVVLLDADLADVQEVGVPDLLAQRSGELDGVDALAHDDHLVPVFAVELHGVDAARRRRQRHGLGPALVAAHAHPDHDLLLRVRIDDVCMC